MTEPIFIDSDAGLAHACRIWCGREVIGVDTEFERTRTYYSKPALVQIFDGAHAALIDPLAIDEFAPLAEVLERPEPVKIIHAAEGDLEVLEQLTGVVPGALFDTQTAAALAGHGFSLGYRALVRLLLGEDLAKEETRSDWLARPLGAAQVAYAVRDVLHLLPLHRRLRRELEALGREAWLDEERARLERRRRIDRDPRRAYLRIRAPAGIDAEQLRALRELAEWREREARARDVPRRAILDDSHLLRVAALRPPDAAELSRAELPPKAVARHADALLEAVARARAAQADAPLPPRPILERRHGPWLKALKAVLRERADALGVPAPLLAQTRTLEAMVAAAAEGRAELPEELDGWRRAVIGEPLVRTLETLTPAS